MIVIIAITVVIIMVEAVSSYTCPGRMFFQTIKTNYLLGSVIQNLLCLYNTFNIRLLSGESSLKVNMQTRLK